MERADIIRPKGLLILLTGIYIVHHAIKGKEKSERLFKDN